MLLKKNSASNGDGVSQLLTQRLAGRWKSEADQGSSVPAKQNVIVGEECRDSVLEFLSGSFPDRRCYEMQSLERRMDGL